MTSERFSECLLHIRWTPINIASALQCELSWIEALEAGNEEIPAGLATWLETLAKAHEARSLRRRPTAVGGHRSEHQRFRPPLRTPSMKRQMQQELFNCRC
nr:hypothetical protein [Rhizobium leguminosarum]